MKGGKWALSQRLIILFSPALCGYKKKTNETSGTECGRPRSLHSILTFLHLGQIMDYPFSLSLCQMCEIGRPVAQPFFPPPLLFFFFFFTLANDPLWSRIDELEATDMSLLRGGPMGRKWKRTEFILIRINVAKKNAKSCRRKGMRSQ